MIITPKGVISKIVVSTIAGHSGRGMFPLSLSPAYRHAMKVIKETKTSSITKSSTRLKRVGNFIAWNPLTWKYIQSLPNDSLLNAYELTNDGVEKNANDMMSALLAGYKVIPNFFPEFAKGTDIAIKETKQAVMIYRSRLSLYFWILELNFSCPNSMEKIAENMGQATRCLRELKKEFPWLKIIAKISIVHPYEFSRELEIIDPNVVIHAVNTVPYNMIYNGISPLADVGGGGVSGPESFPLAFAYNKELRKKIKARMIMGNGVGSLEAVRRYLEIGADSVSTCTIFKCNPREGVKILELYNN